MDENVPLSDESLCNVSAGELMRFEQYLRQKHNYEPKDLPPELLAVYATQYGYYLYDEGMKDSIFKRKSP